MTHQLHFAEKTISLHHFFQNPHSALNIILTNHNLHGLHFLLEGLPNHQGKIPQENHFFIYTTVWKRKTSSLLVKFEAPPKRLGETIFWVSESPRKLFWIRDNQLRNCYESVQNMLIRRRYDLCAPKICFCLGKAFKRRLGIISWSGGPLPIERGNHSKIQNNLKNSVVEFNFLCQEFLD